MNIPCLLSLSWQHCHTTSVLASKAHLWRSLASCSVVSMSYYVETFTNSHQLRNHPWNPYIDPSTWQVTVPSAKLGKQFMIQNCGNTEGTDVGDRSNLAGSAGTFTLWVYLRTAYPNSMQSCCSQVPVQGLCRLQIGAMGKCTSYHTITCSMQSLEWVCGKEVMQRVRWTTLCVHCWGHHQGSEVESAGAVCIGCVIEDKE